MKNVGHKSGGVYPQPGQCKIHDLARRLRRAQQIAKIGYWELSLISDQHFYSEEICDLLNMHSSTPSFNEEIFFRHILEDDIPKLKSALQKARTDAEHLQVVELRVPQNDENSIDHVEAKFIGVADNGSDIIRIEGTLQNVNDRVRALNALNESKISLQKAFEIAKIGSYKYSIKEDKLSLSDEAIKVAELKENEIPKNMQDFLDMLHPDDLEKMLKLPDEINETNESYSEHRIKTRKGYKWLHASRLNVYDEHGNPDSLIGVYQDIDERKKEEIRKSNEARKLEITAELAKVAPWEYNFRQEKFTFSDMFYTLYKTSAEEMGGYEMSYRKYFDTFFIDDPEMPHLREQLLDMFSKKTQQEDLLLKHKVRFGNGEIGTVAVRSIPIKDKNGELIRLFGANQDITVYENNKQELERTLSEKLTLLSEVHHRVKNNLALISGLFQLQGMYTKSEELDEKLKQSTTRIKSIAMVHELLYQSSHLNSININKYIEKVIPTLETTYADKNLKPAIQIKACDHEININQAVPIGLILNELITNSFKYAFDGISDPEISIELSLIEDELQMQYRDNGIGLPEQIDFNSSGSLGFTLVKSQLEQLSANYIVHTDQGFGITFTFRQTERGSHSNS
mgnify:CR=1 FL=1